MARVAKILFGSFGERLSVPVFAGNWWFFLASSVELAAESCISLSLADCLPESSARRFRAVPEVIDVSWFRTVSSVGLQLRRGFVIESPLRMGLVAARVQDDRATGGDMIDLAYPFVLVEEAGRLFLQLTRTRGGTPT